MTAGWQLEVFSTDLTSVNFGVKSGVLSQLVNSKLFAGEHFLWLWTSELGSASWCTGHEY